MPHTSGETGRLDTLIISHHIDLLSDHHGKFTSPSEKYFIPKVTPNQCSEHLTSSKLILKMH